MTRMPWIAFALALLFAIVYFSNTLAGLPPLVASHFDGAGFPTAHMTREFYYKFLFAMGVGFPVAMVALLSVVYMKANDMKLPNRDYWLAPERIAQTRSLLVSHAVWFGCLMVAIVCYMHWLVLGAHRSVPPHLSNQLVMGGLLVFMAIAVGWIFAVLRAFRLPRVIT
jgi:cytochrome bd-type quinol oxidase subunit 1